MLSPRLPLGPTMKSKTKKCIFYESKLSGRGSLSGLPLGPPPSGAFPRPPIPVRCNLCVTALTTVQTARWSGVFFTAEGLECYGVHTRTLSIWTSCIGVLDL